MKLINLYLLNNDWQHDTKIRVNHISDSEMMEMREAINLYGREKVLWFTRSEVMLYKGD